MSLPASRKLSSLAKLSLFVVLLLTVVIFATVSFSWRQQGLVAKALAVDIAAKAQCNGSGEAEIAVEFNNLESGDSMAVNVRAKDVQTGLTADMGKVAFAKTGTAVIETHRGQLGDGSVIFFLSWENSALGTDQRGSTYSQVSCGITPTPKAPTVTKAVMVGDVKNDGVINILDYNLLTGCYGNLHPADVCDSSSSMAADLTHDGRVNQLDYNLFLRGFEAKIKY